MGSDGSGRVRERLSRYGRYGGHEPLLDCERVRSVRGESSETSMTEMSMTRGRLGALEQLMTRLKGDARQGVEK